MGILNSLFYFLFDSFAFTNHKTDRLIRERYANFFKDRLMQDILFLLLLIVVGIISGFLNVLAGGGSAISLPLLIFLGLDSPWLTAPTVWPFSSRLLPVSFPSNKKNILNLKPA